MEIKMQFSGRWFVPVIFCDGCGQEIKRLDDGIAYYNSKLRTGEQGKLYLSHVMGRCVCVIDEKMKEENEGRAYFLCSMSILDVFLNVLQQPFPPR